MGAIGATLGLATKVAGTGVRLVSAPLTAAMPRATTAEYHDTLRTLSEASVEQHFEAFKDIPWDDPDCQMREGDRRFILSVADPIGGSEWYQGLPEHRQIEIGIIRWAQIAKVGRQFEQILIGGVMLHLIAMPDGNPEFRYAMHEVTEETHHIQMFQEAVNRAGVQVQGAPAYFTKLAWFITSAGQWIPEVFFTGILAGEEPIDHLQKSILRAGGGHPLTDRIMQIHIAEEARHIGFAHQWLQQHYPELGPVRRQIFKHAFPLAMWWLCDVIMIPVKADREAMGIPPEVAREIWWDSPEGTKRRRDMFGDVRMLADGMGIRTGTAGLLWKVLGLDGAPSRYRSEPASAG